MNRKRSSVWNHFSIKSNTIAKCGYCPQEVSYSGGSTGNLIRHLKTKHIGVHLNRQLREQRDNVVLAQENEDDPIAVTPSNAENAKNIDDVPSSSNVQNQPTLLNYISSVATQRTATVSSASSMPVVSTVTSLSSQTSMSSYIIASKPISISKSKAIDQQITRFIVKHFHPFSLVEQVEFRKLIKMLVPNYTVPTRKTVANSLLMQLYESVYQKVKLDVQNVSAVSITTDAWTSTNNQSFMSVTVHFINSDTQLCSRLLGCFSFTERHTSDELSKFLLSVVNDWGLENMVAAAVTDNAANIKSAIKNNGWRHISCFAHVLNIAVQKGLESVHPIIAKVKSIVEYFKRSTLALNKLKNLQQQMGCEQLKLIQDCKTRWNSTFHMIQRILKVKDSVLATLAVTNNELNNITSQEWELLSQCCNVLSIFNDVTEEVSAEKIVTISKVVLYYGFLDEHLTSNIYKNDTLHEVEKMATDIQNVLRAYFGNLEDKDVVAQSIILDPRFKKQGFSSDSKFLVAKTVLSRKLQSIRIGTENTAAGPSTENPQTAQTATTSLLWKTFDNKVNSLIGQNNPTVAGIVELDKYLAETLIPRSMDPLQWWSERKHIYPRLFEVVKRRLCIPGTSVPSERVFSKAGQVLTDFRSRLTTDKVEKIVFVQCNLK
ncbi:unnamed protein product [Macrosiphum euphorbiae]|uniref:BED-type domain-containing protein n=1 Tax=Macrosiphum euphorbiae TaxID=13131 RepID=A0AAV0Y680_9HEMI|nr:unnamed protein product [Macrosiphum euphorbiae]